VTDRDCVEFLQWALPRLRLQWSGFRKVRRQVCRRLHRRIGELGLPDLDAYRERLARDQSEWARLDQLTRITISRFHRDRGVFEALVREVLPALALGRPELRAWSVGCASGEEPYTLALAWNLELQPRFPAARLEVLATDVDVAMLERARRGCYAASSLKDLPEPWRRAGFIERGGSHCLRSEHRQPVTVRQHDVRTGPIDGPWDLILCRNLVFTYFAPDLQREVCDRFAAALRPGGALVLGAQETLPRHDARLEAWTHGSRVYRRIHTHSSTE
jgi:chemotaxis protein methyltransferase CheR